MGENMKGFLKYIESEPYRKWLEENSDKLDRYDYMQLILGARADIRDKLPDLIKLRDSLDETDNELCELDEAIIAFSKAIAIMNGEYPGIRFMKELGCYNENDKYEINYCFPCGGDTFEQGVEASYAEAYGYELGDDDYLTWNVMCGYEKYTNDIYELPTDRVVYRFGHDGVVWTASVYGIFPDKEISNFYDDMGALDLITPFEAGDIITIDCRPFHYVFHAVVIPKNAALGEYEDCCSPCVLFLKKGKIHRSTLNYMFRDHDSFSPLLRAEIFDGELPENEKLIGEIGKYIRTHEDGAEKIAGIAFDPHSPEYQKSEEMLMRSLCENRI